MRCKVYSRLRCQLRGGGKVLFQQLDLSGLKGWSEGNQVAARALLAKYHDIFYLEPGKLGCTNLTNKIRVVDNDPLKSSSKGFPHPWWMRVQTHMKEILVVDAMHPSQSPWCNSVVLVHKKDRGLHVCIDFHNLNARTKKHSLSAPPDTRGHWKTSGSGILLLLRPDGGFLANYNGWGIKAVYCIHCGKPRIFYVNICHFGCAMPQLPFQRLMQNCLRELNLAYCLIYLDDMIVFSKMEAEHLQHLCVVFNCFWEHNLKLKPTSANLSGMKSTIWLIMSPRGCEAQQRELESCGWVHSILNLHRNLSLSGLGGALLAIHQRVCMYCATLTQASILGRCQ